MSILDSLTVDVGTRRIVLPPRGHFVGGDFCASASGGTMTTINPATGSAICEVARAGAQDVDAAVAAARRCFESADWQGLAPRERGEMLFAFADAIEAARERLAAIETLDNGKPYWESYDVDLRNVLRILRFYAGAAHHIEGETLPVAPQFLNYTRREAIGVCGLIVPWNFPLLMAMWKIAPALAAGNTVVLKPAELTPLSALALAELSVAAGLPAGALNVVNGTGAEAGAALAGHGDVDKVAFTGSTATGRAIMTAAAQSNLKRVSLELGGKSPVIVFPDADLDAVTADTVDGIYFNQGEVCSAGSRMYVAKSVAADVVERLAANARARVVGDPFAKVDQGALVSEGQLRRVADYVAQGQAQGARLVTGGRRLDMAGYFFEPTLFDGATDDMVIAREEIFGPVMTVMTFDDDDVEGVVARANASDYGLAAAVYSRDMGRALRVAHAVRAGTVWINTAQNFDPASPFGGVKQSGFGRDCGQHALDEYTQVKSVWARLG